jgi:hypothetical protein
MTQKARSDDRAFCVKTPIFAVIVPPPKATIHTATADGAYIGPHKSSSLITGASAGHFSLSVSFRI